eukprot:1687853-Karenia_brevis.AAC.1
MAQTRMWHPHIRQFGLQPSTEGAGMKEGDTPHLYTSTSENTSWYFARPCEFPFDTRSDCGVFGVQDTVVYKTFQTVMGVASKVFHITEERWNGTIGQRINMSI